MHVVCIYKSRFARLWNVYGDRAAGWSSQGNTGDGNGAEEIPILSSPQFLAHHWLVSASHQRGPKVLPHVGKLGAMITGSLESEEGKPGGRTRREWRLAEGSLGDLVLGED